MEWYSQWGEAKQALAANPQSAWVLKEKRWSQTTPLVNISTCPRVVAKIDLAWMKILVAAPPGADRAELAKNALVDTAPSISRRSHAVDESPSFVTNSRVYSFGLKRGLFAEDYFASMGHFGIDLGSISLPQAVDLAENSIMMPPFLLLMLCLVSAADLPDFWEHKFRRR